MRLIDRPRRVLAGAVVRLTDVLGEVCGAMGAPGWEATMRHQPVHKLHRLDIAIVFEGDEPHANATIKVTGRSDTKRTALWNYAEAFDGETSIDKGYSLNDAVAHIVLACHQDRPNTLARLDFALTGGIGWQEERLF